MRVARQLTRRCMLDGRRCYASLAQPPEAPAIHHSTRFLSGAAPLQLALLVLNVDGESLFADSVLSRLWKGAALRMCADGGANRLHDGLPAATARAGAASAGTTLGGTVPPFPQVAACAADAETSASALCAGAPGAQFDHSDLAEPGAMRAVDGDSGEDDEDRAFHYTAALHGGDPEGLDRLRGATAGASVPAAATIRSPLFTQPRETRWYVVQGGPHEGVYSITAARSMIVSTYNREIAPLYEHFAGASVARCASETEAESTLRGIQAASLFLCVCLCMMPCFWA